MSRYLKVFLMPLFAVWLVFAPSAVLSQNAEWFNYTCGSAISTLLQDGDFIWVGTEGGLVRINKTTMTRAFYTRQNSGLPSNSIYAMTMGSLNKKWIATSYAGLVELSGSEWKRHDLRIDGALLQPVVDMVCDSQGVLWLATRYNGLCKFDGVSVTNYNTDNSPLPSNYIASLAIDSTQNLWIGTGDLGLVKYDGVDWIIYNTRNSSLPYDGINKLAVDLSNRLWIGMKTEGVVCFDGLVWKIYYSIHSNVLAYKVTSIAFDDSGNTWVGCMYGGLTRFDGSTWTQNLKTDADLRSTQINAILVDDADKKWVGTWYEGLSIYDDTSWQKVNISFSDLPYQYITSIAIDDSGTIWLGFFSGYVAKFDRGNWMVYDYGSTGIPFISVYSLAIDALQRKWFATYSGLVLYDGVQWQRYTPGNSELPALSVHSLALEGDNILWIGTYGGGLARYDGQSWMIYSKNNSALPDSIITALAVDHRGHKWIGTKKGLAQFYDSAWTIHDVTNSVLPDNQITALCVDAWNRVWVGTKKGLALFDSTGWTTAGPIDLSGINYEIRAIAVESAERIWLGTYTGGLMLIDGPQLIRYDMGNSGLLDQTVNVIRIDQYHNKWLGTTSGLAIYNEDGVDFSTAPETHSECGGFALQFNGKDQYVDCGSDSSLALDKAFTLCAWIYRGTATYNWERILAKSDEMDYDYWLQLRPQDQSIGGGINFQDGTPGKHVDGIGGTAVPLAEWCHLALTYDGNKMCAYLNGVLDKSREIAGLIRTSNKPLWIGRLQTSFNYTGLIDEVSIWDRALLPQQIRENMHCKVPAVSGNLAAHWHFDEGRGIIANDKSGNKNHGYIYGAEWLSSTAPVAAGQSQTLEVSATGEMECTHTNLMINFIEKSGIDTMVVTELDCIPFGNSPGGLFFYDSTQYWIIEKYGKGTFKADISFYLKTKLAGPHDPQQQQSLFLLRRPCRDAGNWMLAGQAAAVADDHITFKDISESGQYAIGSIYPTAIRDHPPQSMREMAFSVFPNYPNPFNPSTTISYNLPKSAVVNISVYNVKGQLVKTLVYKKQEPGYYSIYWNAGNLSSGVYLYRIDAGEFSTIRKCLLLR
ncbi:T9SS type A sorting domain-containing protein [candidate division KSB1 bacterium]|nr:T9SS type A sorting domain-containing protein [candidate division KSB1 bacterium]